MTITIRILTHIYCFIVKTGFGATQTAENPLEMASTWSWSESFPCLTAGQRNGDSEDEIDCICLVCFITNTTSRKRSQDKPMYFFTWLRAAKKILQITERRVKRWQKFGINLCCCRSVTVYARKLQFLFDAFPKFLLVYLHWHFQKSYGSATKS